MFTWMYDAKLEEYHVIIFPEIKIGIIWSTRKNGKECLALTTQNMICNGVQSNAIRRMLLFAKKMTF